MTDQTAQDVADEIEQQVLPALADAVVAADVHGDFGPHVRVRQQLEGIVQNLRAAVGVGEPAARKETP